MGLGDTLMALGRTTATVDDLVSPTATPPPRPEPEPPPEYRIMSKPAGRGWHHWIVSIKPQCYKDPKRLEWEREEGPFKIWKEAKARLDVLNA